MRLVVFGLTLSSSWGNGHATTYRALLKAFAARGHDVTFFERDESWYADNRDLGEPDFCRLILYKGLNDLARFGKRIDQADGPGAEPTPEDIRDGGCGRDHQGQPRPNPVAPRQVRGLGPLDEVPRIAELRPEE